MSHGATLTTEQLRGVSTYDPGEFTFTAWAGTPLREIRDMLAEHRQFLPFDPPLVEAGATLGGAVAAGCSGPGRFRFGGLRDFFLGAKLVTGEGRVVFGGGKVVKNAAGFDIPKLMVGSQGAYGVLAELTFKVFPQVESYATVVARCDDLATTLKLQAAVAASPLEPACLDVIPPGELHIRVGGLEVTQDVRLARLEALCHQHQAATTIHRPDDDLWSAAREFRWATQPLLACVPMNSGDIGEFNGLVDSWSETRYSVAGNAAWICCDTEQRDALADACRSIHRTGVILRGSHDTQLGDPTGEGFRRRLLSVFDPQGKLAV